MSITTSTYWDVINTQEYIADIYINVSCTKIRRSITGKMRDYVYTEFLEPERNEDLVISKKNLRDILRIVHHHYRNGKSIVVFCYHGINRSKGVEYYYHRKYNNREIEYKPSNILMYELDV
jgi:protein-tyrosine phosphatase